MALRAFDFDVHFLQRVFRGGMLLHAEERGLPAVHCMAFRAFAFFLALGKLTAVRIGFVAVHALRKSERLFEIAADMASRTSDGGVLS